MIAATDNLVSVAAAAGLANILPSGFENLKAANTNADQLNNFKSVLNSAAQGMTAAERDDYDIYMAFFTEFPNEVKGKPLANVQSMTVDYLAEHFTGHATASKGNVLAMATLAVEAASYYYYLSH
jgi:hypothetical protein